MGRINRKAYEQLISEDKAWLLTYAPASLERSHILEVLQYSAKYLYPERIAEKTLKGND